MKLLGVGLKVSPNKVFLQFIDDEVVAASTEDGKLAQLTAITEFPFSYVASVAIY